MTLLDEAHNPVRTWLLRGCIPMKYTGPTLAGKGGSDVAMEELVLSAEGFEIQAQAMKVSRARVSQPHRMFPCALQAGPPNWIPACAGMTA